MLITPASLRALQTTFSSQFRQGYGSAPTWYDRVSMTISSSTKIATYGWMARIPKMREWVGPRVVENLNSHAYTLENKDYELTVSVDRNDWEDENLGIYTPLMEEMGRAAAKWPDDLMKTTLQAGTTALTFDGVSFFNTAHPLDPAATQSNNFTGSPLNAANYASVREKMMCLNGEDGRPLGIMPNLLIVPPQLEQAARIILNAEFVVGTEASSTGGNTNVLRGSADLLVVPELCNQATTWYLADTSRPVRPLVFQQRKAPQFVAKTQVNDDNVFYDREFVWGTDSRGAGGYSLWFLMARAIA